MSRIIAVSTIYPPFQNNGGSVSLHLLLKYLRSKGHEVRVINPSFTSVHQNYIHDGIQVNADLNNDGQYNWAEVMITQLYATNKALGVAMRLKKPLLHMLHSNETMSYTSVLSSTQIGDNYIIYNSEHNKAHFHFPYPSVVLNPIVSYEYYSVNANPIFNDYITLINLNYNKGVKTFYEIARRLPDHKFLGVLSNSKDQVVEKIPNVTFIEHKADILPVYQKTRVLLMPSEFESWGRTATEAMCSGIPVICSATDGLKENCKDAAIYVEDRNDVEKYISIIKSMDEDPFFYQEVSDKCRTRAEENDSKEQLERVEEFLMQIIK